MIAHFYLLWIERGLRAPHMDKPHSSTDGKMSKSGQRPAAIFNADKGCASSKKLDVFEEKIPVYCSSAMHSKQTRLQAKHVQARAVIFSNAINKTAASSILRRRGITCERGFEVYRWLELRMSVCFPTVEMEEAKRLAAPGCPARVSPLIVQIKPEEGSLANLARLSIAYSRELCMLRIAVRFPLQRQIECLPAARSTNPTPFEQALPSTCLPRYPCLGVGCKGLCYCQ